MSRTIRIITITFGLLLGVGGLLATGPHPATAATQFFVDSTGTGGDPIIGDGVCNDGTGKCTFQAAVEEAQSTSGLPTVVVPPGTYPLNAPKGIANTIRILGSGQSTTTIEWQGPTGEVPFQVGGPDSGLWMNGLTLDGEGAGGGITVEGGVGTVSLEDVRLTDFTGSGIFSVGATTGAIVTIERSTFDDVQFGVFVMVAKAVTVRTSVFTDMAEGGVVVGNTSATVDSSTFYDAAGMGVIVNAGGSVDVVNSTFSDLDGAAVFAGAAGASASVESSTITDSNGQGFLAESGGSIDVQNSVVQAADNDCQGATSKGYNVDSDGTCNSATGDVTAADPMLGPLADNGGPTQTHLPAAGSPVIDAADTAACPATDQRGYARPSGVGAACDIGAVEVEGTSAALPADASQFVPLPPARVFDTRPGQPAPGPKGFVAADQSIDVQIAGVAGIPPTDVAAVVLNVTATQAAGPGFITVWPTGLTRPLASTHNLTVAGQTRPNLVTVPLGTDGKVSFYAKSGAHLLADVAGYYTNTAVGVSSGRFVALAPARVFDTRAGQPAPGPKGLVAADKSIDVQMTGVEGIPATGVSAVVINLTGTAAVGAGFVTAWPTGQTRPLASNVNLNGPGDTAPNLAVVPVGTGGQVSFYAKTGAHLLADVLGYFTDDTAAVETDGLFVPLPPARVFDTRAGQPAAGPKGFVGAGQSITVAVAGAVGVPASGAAAAVLNLTATGAADIGYVTGWPTGGTRPLASNINLSGPGDTRPNAAFLLVGTGGEVSLFVLNGADLLADVSGYYLG